LQILATFCKISKNLFISTHKIINITLLLTKQQKPPASKVISTYQRPRPAIHVKTHNKHIVFDKLFASLTEMMYFCTDFKMITTTEAILNYAAKKRGTFLRKDLLADIASQQPNINKRAVDLQLSRLVASGIILRKERGIYTLAENVLPEYTYRPSNDEKDLFHQLKQKFPLLDFCIWSPRMLTSFMIHIPMIDYILVDVEKIGVESVFNTLQSMNLGRNVLMTPSLKECNRYLFGTNAIVVRQLIGQSPLTVVDGCVVPRIEKILVDLVGDNELFFAGGSETYNIYEFARERNNVNMSKLLRYASRRNRKDKVEQIINSINND